MRSDITHLVEGGDSEPGDAPGHPDADRHQHNQADEQGVPAKRMANA